ncbi:methionine/alanine import NSS transporter subunit MetS [Corynebacterium lizhenjunii]|uniref:Methionine/alanine import NSS transporter subunit MetS n=1 Tax=Corynebacterium lizhenjunii TaxID=2709394 RepID=A0A7T0PCF2_9CORY|nr:methionine/alanine import NSS transporter subunit MetS [Corynebacterium lizhenjunii]QPK79662.1 methionine/alanine import NSS transporter subunit MetS [Corynebacterium lizhenjunii]
MSTSALFLLVLFIVVVWGGLGLSAVLLARSDDNTTGELGNAPGTDDETLMHRVHA